MPNSADQVEETVYTPEEAIDYSTWLKTNDANSFLKGDNSFWGRFIRFFDGSGKLNEANYQTYLNNLNARNDAKSYQSAKAWEEMMSNTSYSRAFADLEKLGVNPYILLNSGSLPSTNTGSVSRPSSNYSKGSSKDATSDKDFATILIMLAAMFLTKGKTGGSANNVARYPIASFR